MKKMKKFLLILGMCIYGSVQAIHIDSFENNSERVVKIQDLYNPTKEVIILPGQTVRNISMPGQVCVYHGGKRTGLLLENTERYEMRVNADGTLDVL